MEQNLKPRMTKFLGWREYNSSQICVGQKDIICMCNLLVMAIVFTNLPKQKRRQIKERHVSHSKAGHL